MKTNEATPSLTWLDEERRRDKALITELQKSMEQHESHLSNVNERMERLDENLARSNAELTRMTRFEEALQKFKDEILLELRGSEERLRHEGEEREKYLRGEGRDRANALVKLGQRVEEALQLGDRLQTQQVELQRLNKATSSLQLQLEEALKQEKKSQEKLLMLMERLDRSDEKLANLLQERDGEKVRSESINEKLRFLEDWAERGTRQMADLQAFGERLREEQVQSVEQLRAIDDQRKKQIDNWAKEMKSWRQMAEELRDKSALMDKQYRSAEKMLAALDELKTHLERHRETLEHVQHTGEERLRQQLEEWREENQMLWLRNDERWQQLSEENAKRDGRLALLWESQTEHLRRQVKELAQWIKDFDRRRVRSKK